MYSSSRRLIVLAALLGLFSLSPQRADAHFVLEEPTASRTQDSLGNPQKLGPCGLEGGSETGDITALMTGQTLTITIHETIFHPGHYRVSIAPNDPSELPPEPVVTPGSDSPCGSVAIMDPPVFPVLADGMLLHTQMMSGPQSFDVTLPAGMTCEHCTIQVLEFMAHHPLNVPGGCFYHHCATVSIQDVVVGTDASSSGMDASSGGMDAGSTTSPPQACACSAPGQRARASLASLAALPLIALTLWRRHRAR